MAGETHDLTISGPFDKEEVTVEHLTGREELGTPFKYEVSLLCKSPSLDLSKFIGDTVTVTMLAENGKRYFNGYVTRAALVSTFDRNARYHLTLRPWFWIMSPRTNNRIFSHKTVPQIAKILFGEHGFTDFDDTLGSGYKEKDFVVQYRESDFAFISRLFEKAGIYYYFKHEEKRHVMVLGDAIGAHGPVAGYKEIPYFPPAKNAQRRKDHIDTWQMVEELRSGRSRGAGIRVVRGDTTGFAHTTDLTADLSSIARGFLETYLGNRRSAGRRD